MPDKEQPVSLDSLTYPLFVKDGTGLREPVVSMPGIFRFSPDTALEEAAAVRELGLRSLILFGIPRSKDRRGRQAMGPGSVVARTVAALKKALPDIRVTTDVCLCAYTDHGHCGILEEARGGVGRPVARDGARTLEALAQMALSHAAAGADCVAPSAMMEGQVRVLRRILNKAGFAHTRILAYSAKFASQFYGPFREAADSAPRLGDGRPYQLPVADADRALERMEADIAQGADEVMVKPALGYQDVIRRARDRFRSPLVCYNVSGEYAMVKAGARQGWWDERRMVAEIMSGMRRAGADTIISYHAHDIALWRREHGGRR
ncbi:MAG: porphobilinogen synthase [Deltaproteobacteria bacterium]